MSDFQLNNMFYFKGSLLNYLTPVKDIYLVVLGDKLPFIELLLCARLST